MQVDELGDVRTVRFGSEGPGFMAAVFLMVGGLFWAVTAAVVLQERGLIPEIVTITEGTPRAAVLGFFLIGLVPVAFGLVVGFGNSGHTLDRAQGRLVRFWGVLVPLMRRSRALADFDRVVLGYGEDTSGETASWVVLVVLAGRGEPVALYRAERVRPDDGEWSRMATEARRVAADTAAFLGWPLRGTVADPRPVEGAPTLTANPSDAQQIARLFGE